MFRKIIAIVFVAGAVSACDTTLQSVGLGAAVGAAGAAAVGGDVATGALIGGGIGLACDQTNSC